MLIPAPDLLPGPDLLPEESGGPVVFRVQITDLYGNVLPWTDAFGGSHDWIDQYSDLSVTAAVSDDRQAQVTLSLYHPAVANLIMVTDSGNRVAALGRMIRIKFRQTTIFWGIVVQPRFSTERAQVELSCQGPTYKLRHRQLNLGDDIVGTEEEPTHNPSDWTTVQAIVEAAYDTVSQYAENIPDIGVVVENVDAPEAPDAFWTDIQRGEINRNKIDEICESAYGPEYDVVPYDPAPSELPFDTTLVPVEEG
jgi:hypothetical protein